MAHGWATTKTLGGNDLVGEVLFVLGARLQTTLAPMFRSKVADGHGLLIMRQLTGPTMADRAARRLMRTD